MMRILSGIENNQKTIGSEDFYVKGYLTWSQEHDLEVPSKITLSYDDVEDISTYKCCYFFIDAIHEYYLQAWSLEESKEIKLNIPDLIHVRYGQMSIFSGDLVHVDGQHITGPKVYLVLNSTHTYVIINFSQKKSFPSKIIYTYST